MAEPFPRLMAFQLIDQQSPLQAGRSDEFVGLRTWFMEPIETDESGLPARQPAELGASSPGRLQLIGGEEPVTGLRVEMDFGLHPNAPRLVVTHALHNLRQESRRIAAWAINAVDAQLGIGFTAWSLEARRKLMLFHDTVPGDAPIRAESSVLALDFRVPPTSSFCKVGTDTSCGWGAFAWNGTAMKSMVAHDPDAEYPEGGATVTLFNSGEDAGVRFGEVENVGPLSDVAPGGSLSLVQTLELIDGIDSDDLSACAARIAIAN